MNWRLNYKILNLILIPLLFFAGILNYETWSHFNDPVANAPKETANGLKDPFEPTAFAVKEKANPDPSPQAYGIISEKNIFNPERKDFLSADRISAEHAKPAVRPQVILHGVVISDNYQSASVSSPGRPLKKGERDSMGLKLGDRIGEYKLAKISDDRITMEAAGDSFEVLLYDRHKPKTRAEMAAAIQPIIEARPAQPAPAIPPPGETAKAESMEKPASPSHGMAIAAAPPSVGRIPLNYSRESRSKRYGEMSRGPGNQQNAGNVESPKGNRDK